MKDFLLKPFREGNSLMQLIYINVCAAFLLLLLNGILGLFNIDFIGWAIEYLQLPSSWSKLTVRAWTLITYMFLHFGFLHLFFNLICLYWFGQIFLQTFSKKQLVGLYLLGGIAGGLFYVLCYSTLPFFADKVAVLCGASAAIMAITAAAAFAAPNLPLRLLFFGEVKLKYLAAFAVAMSFFGITGKNAGGEISHIGGALMGWLWFVLLNKNVDLTKPFDKIITFFVNIFDFDGKPLKIKKPKQQFHYRKSDEEYNQERAKNNAEIDKILDKVRLSGYTNLTESEKQRLFDLSNKI
ncbi:MAG: rhomboid family intramembrane serine protease [Prevotellaceae bacterium]|jgi:membrane associated rhomboid family serine protease|nr:rhomboid family intramembrane serine protease [Prevotellaceae bacterium]